MKDPDHYVREKEERLIHSWQEWGHQEGERLPMGLKFVPVLGAEFTLGGFPGSKARADMAAEGANRVKREIAERADDI